MHTAHINSHIYKYILYIYVIIFFCKAGMKSKVLKILKKYFTAEQCPMTLLEITWKVPKATVSTGEAEGDMTRRNILALASVKGETTGSDSPGPASQEIRPFLTSHSKGMVLLYATHMEARFRRTKQLPEESFFPNLGPDRFAPKLGAVEILALPTLKSISLLLSSSLGRSQSRPGLTATNSAPDVQQPPPHPPPPPASTLAKAQRHKLRQPPRGCPFQLSISGFNQSRLDSGEMPGELGWSMVPPPPLTPQTETPATSL